MIQLKFKNIKELKINKVCKTSKIVTISLLNKFLWNILFNQIKLSSYIKFWSQFKTISFNNTSL